MLRFPALLLLAAAPVLTGCFAYHRGDPARLAARPEPLPADAWPARDPGAVLPLLEATPDRVRGYRAIDSGSARALSPEWEARVSEAEFTVVAKGVYGAALVREVRSRSEDEFGLLRLLQTVVPNGYVLTSRAIALNPNRTRLAAERDRPGAESHAAMLAAAGVARDSTAERILLERGVSVHFPEELPASARGVLIHLWALAYNEYEASTIAEFERRGWVVIEIDSIGSVRPDLSAAGVGRILALEAERRAIEGRIRPGPADPPLQVFGVDPRLAASPEAGRYFEILREINALEYPGIPLCSEADTDGAAALAARLLDDAGAENAYAAEATLEHVLARHPSLSGLPVVIIGFSAGALSAPAAAARIRDRVDALVLVGGAANVAGVAGRSVFSSGGLRYRCNGADAPADLVAQVAALYLEHSRLDPYHVAPALRGLPVLHVYAPYDEWVPSDLARLLNERLGGPDTLVTSLGGHKALFYFLPRQAGRIADWVERAVR